MMAKCARLCLTLFCMVLVLIAGHKGPAYAQTAPPTPHSTGPTPSTESTPPPEPHLTDIHDIKPPERPIPRPYWLYYTAATALVLFLIAAIVLILRRWKRKKTAPAVPQLPPDQQALKDMEALRDVAQLDGRTFYFRLSAIVREYLRGRFGLNAPEMTLEELLPRIKDLNLPPDLAGDLRAFFRNAEPVKFAGASAVEKQMEADVAFAMAFVRKTTSEKNAEVKMQKAKHFAFIILSFAFKEAA